MKADAILAEDKDLITCEWNKLQVKSATAQTDASKLRNDINDASRAAFNEQQCYSDRLHSYAAYLLNNTEMTNLQKFATANRTPINDKDAHPDSLTRACHRIGSDQWPIDKINTLDEALNAAQSGLNALVLFPHYKEWLADHKDANDMLSKLLADTITKVEGWQTTVDPYKSFAQSVSFNNFWRAILQDIASRQKSAKSEPQKDPFNFYGNIDCSNSWYGRGRIDKYTLHVSDLNTPPISPPDIQIVTNTCYPPSVVSTGLGMSFVHDSVYSFQPGRDPANPNNTVLAIGTTTDASVTPLYAIQYNISVVEGKDVGFHGAIGAAVGSTSGTTNLEFLFGPSFSFHRRAFFITPALQLARRDQLLPGYQIGSIQGNGLTSLPIRTNWKPGLALTFTFGVGP